MRRDSVTVVAIVGEVTPSLLAEVGRSANVAVLTVPQAGDGHADPPDLEDVAAAFAAAARKPGPYALVAADPLADVAKRWQAMWNLAADGVAAFEVSAAELLGAWRAGRLDLPDYYLVIAPAAVQDRAPDLYLGPLRAARPRRVEVVAAGHEASQAAAVRQVLGHLRQGPWWPPLDELVASVRNFFAGGQQGA